MKKLFTIIILLAASGVAFATSPVGDANIQLISNAEIMPKQADSNIPLTPLHPTTLYEVTCTITNPLFQTDAVEIQPTYTNPGQEPPVMYTLNGKSFQQVAALTQQTNTLVADNIVNTTSMPFQTNTTLTIGNLDQDVNAVVKVTVCNAAPIVQSAKSK